MANESKSSAGALLGSLKTLQKQNANVTAEKSNPVITSETTIEKSQEAYTPSIPNPVETAARVRQFLEQKTEQQSSYSSYTAMQPQPAQEKRVVLQKGSDFVVEVREKRGVKKNFLMAPSTANALADEAKSLGISQNELINQILKQRYLKPNTEDDF